MKIITYNMRSSMACDGINNFRYRSVLAKEVFQREMPDIFGMQEVSPLQMRFWRKDFPCYTVVGIGRAGDTTDEHSAIAFHREKFELMWADTQWLSPTPFVAKSRYESQSGCPHILTHVILCEIAANRLFHVYNTHTDHISSFARVEGTTCILRKMKEDQQRFPYPSIFMGDLNAYPDAPEIQMITAEEALNLTDNTENLPYSFHDYKTPAQPRIDYIFSHGFVQTAETRLLTDEKSGVFLSDHYPVCAELALKEEA